MLYPQSRRDLCKGHLARAGMLMRPLHRKWELYVYSTRLPRLRVRECVVVGEDVSWRKRLPQGFCDDLAAVLQRIPNTNERLSTRHRTRVRGMEEVMPNFVSCKANQFDPRTGARLPVRCEVVSPPYASGLIMALPPFPLADQVEYTICFSGVPVVKILKDGTREEIKD